MPRKGKFRAEIDRFMEKVSKGPAGCWEWTACTQHKGYGVFGIGTPATGKTVRAHRWAWEYFNGPIPESAFILHYCDNPACVNPDHLFLGTQQDNMEDMRLKGRSLRGELHKSVKLTEEQVLSIRQGRSDGKSLQQLSVEYGVGTSCIWKIVKNLRWKHVPEGTAAARCVLSVVDSREE